MMSIFDRNISVYNGVTDNGGIVTTLGNFLHSRRHVARILELRAETDVSRQGVIKRSLPMATVSGVFRPTRKIENLIQHSGLICIDIDGKDNPDFSLEEIRRILSSLQYVAYAALSARGKGMYAVIPLACPDRQDAQFASLKKEFLKRFGLVLDNCGDVSRLRALSYDGSPYVNDGAPVYEGMEEFRVTPPAVSLTGEYGDLCKVSRCVDIIEANHIDITSSYEEWFNIGASLASLGERGRYFFHVVSRQNPAYRYAETERKFTQLLKGTRRIGLGTFFYWCGQYGISYRRERI